MVQTIHINHFGISQVLLFLFLFFFFSFLFFLSFFSFFFPSPVSFILKGAELSRKLFCSTDGRTQNKHSEQERCITMSYIFHTDFRKRVTLASSHRSRPNASVVTVCARRAITLLMVHSILLIVTNTLRSAFLK